MLPTANCTFNIPSINDDLELDCRLYFPKQVVISENVVSGFAIFAHPYAPLGGCYDDPIVQSTGSVLLQQGFVLCTFNFRGAMSSPGRTSWTGKPELADYVSVYTFMLHLLNVPGIVAHTLLKNDKPLLLLGGYSYGSMIASHLPPVKDVKAAYRPSVEGSSDNEILLRAQEMSRLLIGYLQLGRRRERSFPLVEEMTSLVNYKHEVAMGGYQDENANRRIRRSSSHRSLDMDRVRHSFDRIKNKLSTRADVIAIDQNSAEHSLESINEPSLTIEPEIAYLLISPLLPPIASFTTIFTRLSFERKGSANSTTSPGLAFQNLVHNPTLAIYGDKDTFTSARKIRKWASELQNASQSRFKSREILGAGHFWHENGVCQSLLADVERWITSWVHVDSGRPFI